MIASEGFDTVIRVPLASSGLEAEDIQAVIDTLHSNALTMGGQVRNFEEAMATYLGTKHFVMVNSGSSANLAIMEALLRPTSGKPYLQPGDGVLVPAIAWPTTVWPVIQLGLHPVFVDVNPETVTLDLDSAEECLRTTNHRVRAIFPIHPLGWAIDSEEFVNFCRRHSLVLVSDVCEALGSWRGGRHAGNTSIASSFSFYFSHHITTMEGGGVATDDQALADDLRSIRSHGWSRDRSDAASWQKVGNDVNARFLFVSAGYNIRPMEIQAALGLGQIRRIDKYISRRREIARRVHERIEGTSLSLMGAQTLRTDPRSHSWMLLPIRAASANHAKSVVRHLESVGIETRPILTGNFTAQPSLRGLLNDDLDPKSFTNAEDVSANCFMVGCHHHFTDAQVEYLSDSLRDAGRLVD